MDTLTQRHRAQQLVLRRQTMNQVDQAWSALEWARLDETYPALATKIVPFVQANRRTSAGLTASYLRATRRNAGIRGTQTPVLEGALDVQQFSDSLHSTSVATIKAASGRGVAEQVAMQNGLTLARMSMARLVLNGGRDTLTSTIAADPRAVGYERVLGGSGCDFCQMLAGRGAVYGSESVQFEAHDKCGCTGAPVYR